MKFCGQCGTSLLAEQKATGGSEVERRHLTVMFCDQVNSVARSWRLDPEEVSEITRQYQEACAQVIRTFDGSISQYQGDGMLVYFGYPVAHEDGAQRAVRAGLGILTALPPLNSQLQQTMKDLQDFPLQLRIGIHTGLAIVEERGGALIALGDTPNVASRLEGIAAPDTLVISGATHRLVQGFFECLDLGLQHLEGVSNPVEVYQVVSEIKDQSRFEVAMRTGLTPLVGRERELGLLLERWGLVKEGAGQVVLVSGEAGIGKSRLVQVMKERVAQEQYMRLEARCSPYYQNSALYPVIEFLQRALQFSRDDTPAEKLEKLERALAPYGFALAEVVPLLASLLSLPLPDRYPPLPLTSQKQKEKTQQAVLAWLLAAAERHPVLSVWEDLQWADPSTLELLSRFIDQVPTTHLLIVLTFRPDFTPPWMSCSHLCSLTLRRLPHPQVEEMVRQVVGSKTLPPEVLQQIVSKTDGVPLFVEELTKMVLESGLLKEREGHYELIGPLPALAIPPTLHDSLMTRLDRLGTAKEVAQLGATLGREFPYELLQAVSPLHKVTLCRGLSQLVAAELLYQRGLPPQRRYFFKHALIQEAAYQSLLKSTRQKSHRQIAQALRERFPDVVETQPELLAHHYTAAGLVEQAIPYWQRAGQRAVERSANVEAIGHLTKGLELLKTLPDTPARAQQELVLQITLGVPLMLTKGYAAPEVEKVYSQARELYQQVGESPQFFPILFGLWAFYSVRGESNTAREFGEQLVSLAQSAQDPALLLEAHTALGNTLSFLGELVLARGHLERAIVLYDPQQHRSHAFVYGQDPGVHSLSYATLVLWLLGYPDQARKRSLEAFALAQELSHPYSLAFALIHVIYVHRFSWEVKATQERAKELSALSTEHGFPITLAVGAAHQGWALAEQGLGKEGIIQIRQGIDVWRATGSTLFFQPFLLAMLAEAHGKGGLPEEGLTVLAEALAIVNKTGERFWEAELYRLKGMLMLQSRAGLRQVQDKSKTSQANSKDTNTQHPTPSTQAEAEAEACFLKAIEIARRQSAKSLELRAVMSLSRLWQQQGKKAEARQMLAEIYGWFTEGFGTADLKEAKVILEEAFCD